MGHLIAVVSRMFGFMLRMCSCGIYEYVNDND